MSLNSDRKRVLNQYKSADNLKARIALHERFSSNDTWYSFVFEHLQASDEARVLELGTGAATLWLENAAQIPATWSVTLSDLSDGMLAEAKKAFQKLSVTPTFQILDAQNIDFPDNTFDLVIANHMLYHVPDLDKTVGEVRRVLKPGGKFCAATNGEGHMLELDELMNAWMDDYEMTFERATSLSFLLENGEDILAKSFDSVKRFDLPNNALRVTEAEPLVNYVLSMNRVQAGLERVNEKVREAMLKDLRQRLGAEVSGGPFVIHKSSGLFIAS